MKKLIIISIFYITFLSSLFSQSAKDEIGTYIQNFQYQKALNILEEMEATKENLEQKAFCYKALGRYKEAIGTLDSLVNNYPAQLQTLVDLATCYDYTGKLQESINCYDTLISRDSANVYFKLQKADLLYRKSDYQHALTIYKILNEEYDFKNAIKRSAQCFEKMNMIDSAMYYYDLAWSIDSTDNFSAANLINLNLKTEYYGNAIRLSDTFVEKDSTDKQINLLNALSYYMSDLYEEAVPRFLKCHADGDTSVIVNRSLGLCYYSLKESFKAMTFLDVAYRQDTTNNNVLYCLAISCSEMAEPERAITYFHKLLDRTIPPDLTLYLYYRNLASTYGKVKKYEETIDNYMNAINYGNDNQKMNLYYLIGDLYISKLDDKPKALEYFKLYRTSIGKYLEKEKNNPEPDQEEIKATIEKITHLEKYITDLEKEIAG